MNSLSTEITQISIYLKEKAERINEVALFQPLQRTSHFDEESKPITSRKWRYTSNMPFFRRISLKFQGFFFKYFPSLIPSERLTPEAKFKTILALLLVQEEMRDFFLNDIKRQKKFYHALSEAAAVIGYTQLAPLPSFASADDMPLKISRYLTQLDGKPESLIDDPFELNLQLSAMKHQERSEILYRILNRLERPPITSVIEIIRPEKIESIPLTTKYAKYKIAHHEYETGKIRYTYKEDHATSSVRTLKNMLPGAKGTMNQRIVFDSESAEWVGSYCGQLSTPFHVMEQLLLILKLTQGEAELVTHVPAGALIEEKKILFSSLYSWHELELITDQKAAIQSWNGKILRSEETYFRLTLLFYNIPFNALNKYPVPGEMKAVLQDINEEACVHLLKEAWHYLGLNPEELAGISDRLLALNTDHEALLKNRNQILAEIDRFRLLKKKLSDQIQSHTSTQFHQAIEALLTDKKPNDKPLKGMDKLLYLDYISSQLGYLHNKNCQNATDRTGAADAADKAQYAFRKIRKSYFLPGLDKEEERELFKVLYSMYLVWEEPEINTWLSTGFLGEKFYNNCIQKNQEATRYMVRWLKKHPELYLGLSDYRI